MALDIYVGPLCRLYSRDFTSDFAQWSLATLGKLPVTVTADGTPLTSTPAAEVLPAILGWRRLITPQFRSAGVTLVDWTETPIGTVKSVRVGWDPYWSLRLLAAYSEFPDLHLPDAPPQDLSQDAALGIIRDHFLRSRFPHLHTCDLWLPLRCADPVSVETPTGHTKPVGAIAILRAELDQIRTRLLAAPDREALNTIANDPARTALIRGAAATLATWLPLCDLALEHRLPMALDG